MWTIAEAKENRRHRCAEQSVAYACSEVAKNKRSKSKQQVPAGDASPLRGSAFAGLADLRETLPAAADNSEANAGPSAAVDVARASATSDGLTLPSGKVVVRREKKGRAGKTVTRVTGLAATNHAAQAWTKNLKRQLGCGGTVEADDVVLLGDLVERVATALEAAGIKRVVRGN